ncbi:MAG: acyl-CoA ligase (AMP-forming), exosortase A system-associated, partial [Pseudomonadota bacterium]|nr:acyl-CoA ligase (AMP-forming), exosortase A system-associated [Pseudomonadota bacterium]
MSELLHQLIHLQASNQPEAPALLYKKQTVSYRELDQQVESVSRALLAQGLLAGERVAFYLPKQPETVYSLFGTSQAGGVFVPVNPLLKPKQVSYILKNCNVRVLITSNQRLSQIADELSDCHDLNCIVVLEDTPPDITLIPRIKLLNWTEFTAAPSRQAHSRIDADVAAILYTSGSTGNPKGVVLSHKNMVTGAKSVATYVKNTSEDRLLAALPFSFDYGLSQLTTAFYVGASVALMDYLLPRDILKAIARHRITGLAGVPPIWNQLVQLEWPEEVRQSLRYITNSGGAMPKAATSRLQELLPNTDIYLMYGLTEAFRSTYLPPDQVNVRPESMGKAIPNAEVVVVRDDGSECAPGEPGELVHRGSLVALGYWNDPAKTAERFRPAPGQDQALPLPEMAVWSGDQVKKDEEGYLYFISRKDEMIKTSGYRVSPTEVEEVIYQISAVDEAAALGIYHPALGEAIILVVSSRENLSHQDILSHCSTTLPNFMVPKA